MLSCASSALSHPSRNSTPRTRVGGIPELIDDGETGLLFNVGDVESMAVGALNLLSDRTRLNQMRDDGRRSAQKRYCASKIVPEYVDFYKEILANQ